MKNVLFYLNNLLKDNDTVVVATSGGPDSMLLLHLLCDIKNDVNINVIAIHINHHLREESSKEALFVEDFCEKNSVIYEYREINFYNGNIEADARTKRYEYFSEIVNKYQAKYLFTAHHGDDLLENILMRLTRGSSIKGYSGFPKETDMGSYKLIRPFITLTKEEILNYMDKNNFKYVIDNSNFSRDYTRNRYRLDMLPFLKKENKNVHLKFLKFSEELIKVNEFLDKYVKKIIEDIKDEKGLKITELLKLDSFLLDKVIEHEISLVYINNLYLINDKHVSIIKEIINNKNSNLIVNLPNNVLAIKEYNYLKFVHNKERCKDFCYILDDYVKVPSGVIKKIEESNLKSNYVIRLNSKKIKLPIYVRNRQDGDKMEVKNLNGTKKIKDILIDSKVSLDKRDIFPIVTDSDNTIIWLPGVKKSKFDVETSGIYDIILSYEEE